MKMPKRTIAVALVLTAALAAFGSMGCDGGGGGETPSAKEDAVKHMGGPPPGAQKSGAPETGKAPAPPGPK